MYFASRIEAGYRLAMRLLDYRYDDCVVVALNEGGVQVGQQIASALHCELTMLLIEVVDLPGENDVFGTLNQSGRFTYNGMFSVGEIEEYYSELHGYLEDQKREKMTNMNRLLGAGGIVDEERVRGRVVILVTDGLPNGASLDAAADFFKPIAIKKLIIATPIASVGAVDRMHIVGDELQVLGVTDNYFTTDHYYEVNDIPSREMTLAALNDIILNWH
jgi:putative phosphoribosyl transferase